uniref:ATP synthase complex subunit 8 n=1 Tax=Ventidius distanti TaxID=3095939 RepID=A0AB38Z6H4_9HEMI|nr:ATP synthase F0 subunit 8 [Ventidius distanti]WPW46869.1 ATP synthase F0 subunit 8 [Ventidius distanti]
MPQMAPLYWFTLMIMFIVMIKMINSIMYFNKNYMNTEKKIKKNNFKMNWKW